MKSCRTRAPTPRSARSYRCSRTVRVRAYAIPEVEVDAVSVVTNTRRCRVPRRGPPEATQAIERAIDLFALEAGLDPAEVRRANLIPDEAFPYDTPRRRYDSGDYGTRSTWCSRRRLRGLRVEQDSRRGPARRGSWGSALRPTSR